MIKFDWIHFYFLMIALWIIFIAILQSFFDYENKGKKILGIGFIIFILNFSIFLILVFTFKFNAPLYASIPIGIVVPGVLGIAMLSNDSCDF